jgi:glycerol-3-phosphate acyltransferase PlsX
MGGDNAPHSVLEGMSLTKTRLPDLHFLLFGNENKLAPLLARHKNLKACVTLAHTDEWVPGDMKPVAAIKGLKRSSMRLAIQAVSEGRAHGVVSAGNTGAYLGLSKLILQTLPGITRPTIASLFPHKSGESVFLDLGANLDCQPRSLVEFSLMGEMFARHVLFQERPRVGLLNVGSETFKGPQVLQDAYEALKKLPLDFRGFVEGDDLTKGKVDVVVTDGFSGNLVLKTAEGVADFMFGLLKKTLSSTVRGKLAYLCASHLFRSLKFHLDPRRYNGALWLGLEGAAVKSHGGADAYAFSYAIDTITDMVRARLSEKIKAEVGRSDVQEILEGLK